MRFSFLPSRWQIQTGDVSVPSLLLCTCRHRSALQNTSRWVGLCWTKPPAPSTSRPSTKSSSAIDLNPRPTIVMIAHRDQSLAYCDRVLRFENSRFVTDEPPGTV